MNNFRTYELAVILFKNCQKLHLKPFLRNQLDRASSSIVLNLAEGNGRRTTNDRKHFFQIAYGSLKETVAILDISNASPSLIQQADILGAYLYRLIQNAR